MALSAQPSPGALPVEEVTCLSDLERSVLMTVTYADLFDYPLRESEILERLVLRSADPVAVASALNALSEKFLTRRDGFVVWKGREHLIAVRRRRRIASEHLWSSARRYARWLARVPFVRSVAVSGSLAVYNAEADGDIDVFCIVAAERLWVARLFIVPMSRATRTFSYLFPNYLCPNYLVTTDALEVEDRNLFTAHEIRQAVPLYGGSVFRDFMRANGWVDAFLPHDRRARHRLEVPVRSGFATAVEQLLRGRFGSVLDALLFRAFRAFYRVRARRRGWCWSSLERAYGRNRYTVPEGGYGAVVGRLFSELLASRFDLPEVRADLARLFPHDTLQAPRCYDWDTLFHLEYDPPVRAYPL